MGQKLHNRIELWKKLLLDFGKRNRLINFIEGKRNNVKITTPSFDKLWDFVVVDEREIVFPYAKKVEIDENGDDVYEALIKGDVETTKSLGDLQKTLKALRQKANTSIEEQGINTLYLTFGMLKWKEQDGSDQIFSSPVILVPVKLLIESIVSPYRLTLHDDEIVINPTLSHKLNNDFGISLPEFDYTHDSPSEYMATLVKIVSNKGWAVEYTTHLTNLSFLKINMYRDLERNEDRLNANHVIAALVGEKDPVRISEDFSNFDHDRHIRPIDTFQVVDADSSQQDAVQLSKRGASFVLQGPPGTGKSQTITNIIAEAIADGKKVLFVSEKMAALQVVYNRLQSVGLADFCFTLHSHKAKKKEILRDLAKSINMERTCVREEALTQLDLLERRRNELNEYQEQLHTPTSGLNISIFAANGRLAKLSNVPDVLFSESNVDSVTNETLSDRIYLLKALSQTIGKRSEDYSKNVWRGSTVKSLTNALRHDIDANIAVAVPRLQDLAHRHASICSLLGIDVNTTWMGNETLAEILSLASQSPLIPAEWVLQHNIGALIDKASQYRMLVERIIAVTNDLQNKYRDDIFDLDVENYKEQLSSLMQLLQSQFSNDDCNYISLNIGELSNDLASRSNDITSLFEEASRLAPKIGASTPETISQLILFIKCAHALTEVQHVLPTPKWFDCNELRRIRLEVDAVKLLHDSVVDVKSNILSRFDKEVLDLDFYPILQNFRGEYQSIFRVFKSGYRHDIKRLSSYLTHGDKLSYSEALSVLNQLKTLSDNQKIICANLSSYGDDYGKYYTGVTTQWDALISGLGVFESAMTHLSMATPQLISLVVEQQLPIAEVVQFNKCAQSYDLVGLFDGITASLKKNYQQDTPWSEVKSCVDKSCCLALDFVSLYDKLMSIRKSSCCYETVLSDLNLLLELNASSADLAKQKNDIYDLYSNYYAEIETDWGKLIGALNFAEELRKLVSKHNLSESFVKGVCTNSDIISYCKSEFHSITKQRDSLLEDMKWFATLFENGNDFYQYNMFDLAERMSLCKDNKHLLEEWVDYCSHKESCQQAGLGEYVYNAENLGVDADYIVDSYLKRFYRLWLDSVLPSFPAVQKFRSRTQSQTIGEFCELDKTQFKIAQARVRERALSRIPDVNSIYGARDEIAILRRELNKQRRLMPLRKLFMSIPNLVTSLRPCFMMSPLSVSVFLEAQTYDFDLVIFDEASQVHTEDAIGAIMRGKQVIVVGDTKQLPPTSFFSTSLNDEDYDVDDDETTEDNDAGAYESILDEAVSILPERSLRWHYRSRHEHLIAFSNVKVYNGQLITFPSSTESAPDSGVEYVYVKNGVYDRGGKKNNVVEAQKVADLVFEHFKKHPNRSLGVVTFSESQQNAVDAAIRQRRLQNPGFDRFFVEDKEEPFFIKNLENVQGDERDTIIFSIGYAKDSKGIMYMNFGPLSREGGYRRLNVAITRAKHNVKLVGSIMPTDIDLDKVSSEGVKMLRSYIEFAQQGIVALEKELSFNYSLQFDSPFEEAVFDFLQSKGYHVVTQVGCSGFRIDMAVKHPTQKGKFAIGIECDGATYHSSRTARERDRLRQAVLEDMGWTIYRIWSTDWIKDTKTEEQKLVNAIEKSLGRAVLESDEDDLDNNERPSVPPIEIEEKVTMSDIPNFGYKFDLYKRACFDMFNKNGLVKSGGEIVLDIVSVEQPIHFEELCRRIAPAYGRQKVTSVVRDAVKYIFRNELKQQIKEDRDGFVKTNDFEEVKVRVPDPQDDYVRPIIYICDEELGLAMKTIALHSFGITPENLFIETAREFGFKRTGETIICTLRKAYQKMKDNGEVSEIDGKVHVVS